MQTNEVIAMNYFEQLLQNQIFINAVIGWFCAQVLKTITHLIVYKKLVWERLIGDGGMPSAHSATVCALATTIFINVGPSSTEFAIAAILAIIVMHDACGVRLETGKQAQILNEMIEMFNNMSDKSISPEEKLKEFVGHTKLQVFMGALLGIFIAILLG
jgi:acid phosphatase family membrane protein YuiD